MKLIPFPCCLFLRRHLLSLLFLPIIGLGSLLLIEAFEKATDFYPVLSEDFIQMRMLSADFSDVCRARERLQAKAWYARHSMPQSEQETTTLQIVDLDATLSTLNFQRQHLSAQKKVESLNCPDFNPMIQLGIPWGM